MNRVMLLGTICLSLVLTSCVTAIDVPDPSLPTNSPTPPLSSPQLSQPVRISINLDGTPSMLGFVRIADSRYVQTLRLLDRAVNAVFSNSQSKYYRFGSKPIEMKGEKSSIKGQREDFYDPTAPELLETQIDNLILTSSSNSSNKLSIIVTDLYLDPQKPYYDKVLGTIKENFQKNKNYAVGLLAVRSEFDGIIYDIGILDRNQQYTSLPQKSETFRPFYVILLGNYDLIVRYFNYLKADGDLGLKNEQFAIFYPRIAEKKIFLDISDNPPKPNLPKGVERPITINNGEVEVTVKNPNLVERLMITGKVIDAIKYEVPYSPLPYTLPFKPKLDIKSEKFNNSNKKFEKSSQTITVNSENIKSNIMQNTLTNIDSIPSGVYKFTVNLKIKDLQEPSWWKEWNFGENKFNPTKTYNLYPFLKDMKKATVEKIEQNNNDNIGQFIYIIHKK
jgi:hypothetical protein